MHPRYHPTPPYYQPADSQVRVWSVFVFYLTRALGELYPVKTTVYRGVRDSNIPEKVPCHVLSVIRRQLSHLPHCHVNCTSPIVTSCITEAHVRCVAHAQLRLYKPGNMLHWPAFSSTSRDRLISSSFVHRRPVNVSICCMRGHDRVCYWTGRFPHRPADGVLGCAWSCSRMSAAHFIDHLFYENINLRPRVLRRDSSSKSEHSADGPSVTCRFTPTRRSCSCLPTG